VRLPNGSSPCCCPPARADGSGIPLVGSCVPTTFELQVPPSAVAGLAPAAGGEVYHSLAGGRPRVFSTPRRFQPRRRSRPELPRTALTSPLRPGTSRPCFMPQTPLGFALQSIPLPESRAAFRRPRASLRVRRAIALRREGPGDLRPVSLASPPRAAVSDPLREPRRQEEGRRELPATVMSGRRVLLASCPARRPSTTNRNLRAPPALDRSARFEALLPPGVRSPTDRASRRGSRARACAPTRRDRRAVSLLGFSPFRAFSATTSGSVDRESRPGRTGRSSEDHAPLRTAERGASILRPRPSGTSGGTRVAARTPHRRTLRASAPPLGGAPASRDLDRQRPGVNHGACGGPSEV